MSQGSSFQLTSHDFLGIEFVRNYVELHLLHLLNHNGSQRIQLKLHTKSLQIYPVQYSDGKAERISRKDFNIYFGISENVAELNRHSCTMAVSKDEDFSKEIQKRFDFMKAFLFSLVDRFAEEKWKTYEAVLIRISDDRYEIRLRQAESF